MPIFVSIAALPLPMGNATAHDAKAIAAARMLPSRNILSQFGKSVIVYSLLFTMRMV
jgi:hypothetical protein